jgi:hypothetical protein
MDGIKPALSQKGVALVIECSRTRSQAVVHPATSLGPAFEQLSAEAGPVEQLYGVDQKRSEAEAEAAIWIWRWME